MKLGKILALMCCAAIAVSAMAGCGSKSGSESSKTSENGGVQLEKGKVLASEENTRQVGRTYMIDDTLWCALSGTGIDFTYTGKKLVVTIAGDTVATSGNRDNMARAAIYVDGERVVDEMIDAAEKSFTVVESDSEKTARVQVIKLSECAMSTFGIRPLDIGEDGKVEPAASSEHKLEFIGDSITCGYGVDDEDENHHFSTTTEDVTKAYAYKTAQKLGADYSMFSVSGYGIISGYTDDPTKKVSAQTIPQYYESLGFSYGAFNSSEQPQSVDWDFSKYTPDAVVINLGTNDASYCGGNVDKQDEYSAEYVELIKTVRSKYPDAHIFCTLGIMGQTLCPAVDMAVYLYKQETGDENISAFKFDQQNGAEDGLAADWHPTEATHEKASDALAAEIKTVMGW